MEGDVFELVFTLSEISVIVTAMGRAPKLLEGVFSDAAVKKDELALQQARESLIAHGYAQEQPNGSLALDTTAVALVGALVFADVALIITKMAENKNQTATRCIYFASGLLVEQEQQDSRTYALRAVRDHRSVIQRLEKYLHLPDQPALPVQPFMLPESSLSEAQCIAVVEGEQACTEFLVSAGTPVDVASSLAQTMANLVSQSSLLALGWEGQEPKRLDGFTLLENGQGLWLLQPLAGTDEARLEVSPCDAAHAKHQVEELVQLTVSKMQKADSQE